VNLGDQDALRRGAWDSGWLLSALTLTMAVLAAPGGRLAARFGNRLPIVAGMALGALGFLAASRWQTDTSYAEMALALALAGAGLGLALAPLAASVIDVVADDRRGSAAAIVIVLRLVGMTLGISALTAWGVQRQDVLRRLGASDPTAATDPARFLLRIATQVVGETFLFAAGACVLGVLVILLLGTHRRQTALS
jgi:MFS family permease